MKKFVALLLLILIPIGLFSEQETVDIKGKEYIIIIPDDLREGYIKAVTAYLEEMSDFEELNDIHNQYKESAEQAIISKDKLIQSQEDLIRVKDAKIKAIRRGEIFSIIPSVFYSRSPEYHGFGVGVGVLLFDSFYSGVQIGYPLEFRLGVGWKF